VVGSVSYKAIKVGTQCWLNKNINLGSRVNGGSGTDATLEKWCYNNSEANCTTYGALYAWSEAMYLPSACNSTMATSSNCWPTQYVTGSGASAKRQGICPKGWHLPSDAEWYYMEDYVDSGTWSDGTNYYADQSGDGTAEYRGTDVATKLSINGASHLDIPAGGRCSGGAFDGLSNGYLWSSVYIYSPFSWRRDLNFMSGRSGRGSFPRTYGLSIRCLKD
jgi:uncharacterized protein (TIGR02145 family)